MLKTIFNIKTKLAFHALTGPIGNHTQIKRLLNECQKCCHSHPGHFPLCLYPSEYPSGRGQVSVLEDIHVQSLDAFGESFHRSRYWLASEEL